MSFGVVVVLGVVLIILIEALNVWLGLWPDRVADRMRRRREQHRR